MVVKGKYKVMRNCPALVRRLWIAFKAIISLIIICLVGLSEFWIILAFASIIIVISGFLTTIDVVCCTILLMPKNISSLFFHLMPLSFI